MVSKTKPRMSLLHYPFLMEMMKTMMKGIKDGRAEGDWRKPIDGDHDLTGTMYFDAAFRHLVEAHDKLSVESYAAAAVNCMIAAYHTEHGLWKAKRELEMEENI